MLRSKNSFQVLVALLVSLTASMLVKGTSAAEPPIECRSNDDCGLKYCGADSTFPFCVTVQGQKEKHCQCRTIDNHKKSLHTQCESFCKATLGCPASTSKAKCSSFDHYSKVPENTFKCTCANKDTFCKSKDQCPACWGDKTSNCMNNICVCEICKGACFDDKNPIKCSGGQVPVGCPSGYCGCGYIQECDKNGDCPNTDCCVVEKNGSRGRCQPKRCATDACFGGPEGIQP